MPTLRQLEYLTAIADTHHFRKAAEKTGVSQPTLSAQLAALEQRLGVQLVERSRSGVLITPVGEMIVAAGRKVMREVQELHDIAASHRGEFGGLVRLGLPPTIGPFLLPRMLPTLHQEHPGFKIYVREVMPKLLPGALADGAHDVVLAPLPMNHADFEVVPIFREPLYVVVPDEHPFGEKGFVERADLEGQTVLAMERGHQLHEQVESICNDFGARLAYDYEGTSLETLAQMTALGLGISFLPGLFVTTTLRGRPGVRALEMKDRSLSRTIGLVWRRTAARRREFELFEGYLRQTLSSDFKSFTQL
ncbi:MAG: LysR substrate-binding domain-containing protein [Pseudomonadota bacterium]